MGLIERLICFARRIGWDGSNGALPRCVLTVGIDPARYGRLFALLRKNSWDVVRVSQESGEEALLKLEI